MYQPFRSNALLVDTDVPACEACCAAAVDSESLARSLECLWCGERNCDPAKSRWPRGGLRFLDATVPRFTLPQPMLKLRAAGANASLRTNHWAVDAIERLHVHHMKISVTKVQEHRRKGNPMDVGCIFSKKRGRVRRETMRHRDRVLLPAHQSMTPGMGSRCCPRSDHADSARSSPPAFGSSPPAT